MVLTETHPSSCHSLSYTSIKWYVMQAIQSSYITSLSLIPKHYPTLEWTPAFQKKCALIQSHYPTTIVSRCYTATPVDEQLGYCHRLKQYQSACFFATSGKYWHEKAEIFDWCCISWLMWCTPSWLGTYDEQPAWYHWYSTLPQAPHMVTARLPILITPIQTLIPLYTHPHKWSVKGRWTCGMQDKTLQ